MPKSIDSFLFAPCGMNCMVCYVHLKNKKSCNGCPSNDIDKPERCRKCNIKNCAKSKELNYCYECTEFPCKTIKNLEKSYKMRYKTSLIDNSEFVRESGIITFMNNEKEKWTCTCKGVISLHDRYCTECKKLLD
jgi:hypothetical protein